MSLTTNQLILLLSLHIGHTFERNKIEDDLLKLIDLEFINKFDNSVSKKGEQYINFIKIIRHA